MSTFIYQSGVLRERWDDTTRIYTAFNSSGVQTSTRAYTAAENAKADEDALTSLYAVNEAALLAKVPTALTTNNTYLAVANPTTAQNTAQVKALTRQVNALLKLRANDLANTSGT